MKERVYCTNCKYYYHSIRLSFHGYIPQNPNHCNCPLNLIRGHRFDGKYLIMNKFADEINEDCDCLNYKRLWYKFWIKEN
jgi:hypothetical protein